MGVSQAFRICLGSPPKKTPPLPWRLLIHKEGDIHLSKMIHKKTVVGKIYPDRSFSLGFCPRNSPKKADREYERDLVNQSLPDPNDMIDWYTGTNTVEGKFCGISEAPLFIKSSKSSRESRGSYGSHGITAFGRKFVKNACVLLERKYGRERLGFVTCSLPGYPKELHHRINGVWSEITRRFYQKLSRQLKKISKPALYVGVTEIQEKRFRKFGVPAPHLHFVYLCRDSKNSRPYLFVCQIHRAWNESIREGISVAGYPFTMSSLVPWGSVHCKTVQKSASAYLGKYLSKGTSVLTKMKDAGWNEFPKQWWSACVEVKEMFKQSVIHMDRNFALSLFYQIEDYLHEGVVTWCQFVDVLIDGDYRTMGLVGTLSQQAYEDIAYY